MTATAWPAVERAYDWVQRAAQILANPDDRAGEDVRRQYEVLLAEMQRDRETAGTLAPAVDHFLKVTASYWPGLFSCYEVADLPRTNNELEQFFGAARYHERRSTGRKVAAPALVVRGSVRVVAAVATRTQPFGADELAPHDLERWRELRAALEARQETRRVQRRFRREPAAYLATLEHQLITSGLPA